MVVLLFQLTTSQGGRPLVVCVIFLALHFNSRPHKEVDAGSVDASLANFSISTHDLTRRSTCEGYESQSFVCISTHDLTRRSTQPTGFRSEPISYFNSRPHKEVDTRRSVLSMTPNIFQLTTSQGGRRHRTVQSHPEEHFNSRPHKEVDENPTEVLIEFIIFQLTTSQGGRPAAVHT